MITCSSISRQSHGGSVAGWMQHALLLSIAILSFWSRVESATNQQDIDTLIALHTAWGGNPSSWDTKTDPCDAPWLGIGCDNATNMRVTEVLLINQDLAGTLPSAIGDLTNLTNLDLSSNPRLGGSLPTEITSLKNLQRLFLQFCNFSGQIPTSIGDMTSLLFLGLTQNSLSGPLPDTVGSLSKLLWLDVSSNSLSGSLPDSDTSASGVGLGNLTEAKHFHLENNLFSGSIPASIFNTNMTLIHLLLHHNNLTGTIPTNVGDLQHLQILRFDSNALNGTVPSGFNTIQNLTTLQLDNNQLSGQLPDLSNKTSLQMLYLGNNSFDAAPIPTWMTNLTSLRLLSFDYGNLIGNIAGDLFSSSPILSNVSLAGNSLNGTLDLSLSSNLGYVNVESNQLTGLTNSNYTLQVFLDGNPFCTNNQALCTFLQSGMTASSNTSSTVCSNICQAGYAINSKEQSNCLCARPVLGSMEFLATKLPLLEDYNLTLMEDQIAAGLNGSQFFRIPILGSQIVVNTITSTQAFLSVFPPNNTVEWSDIDAALISYGIKNQDIFFTGIGPMICAFTGSPYTTVIVNNGVSTGVKVGIAIALLVLVASIAVIGLYAIRQRRRAEEAEKANKPFASWIAAGEGRGANIPQLKGARWFSLEELRNCTNNFSQSNELGEGGYGKVYKGFLASGTKVAIKRAATDSLQGANEFKNEIELLSRVHHRNLVGLIGFCFEAGEQMLVYEYMPNGTLRESLSGKTNIQMDWERRLVLALDSARGIAYLHTEAHPPIIHRDIKSSNILLDHKLVAKVADFGLSELAPSDDSMALVLTQVKGTLGYLDPDYFINNRLTDKSDVYSFGVVLLEFVTGRLPIQGGKYVVREVQVALRQGGMREVEKSLVDPELKEYPSKAMEKLVELALACVQENPDDRPTMMEVVKELEALLEPPSAKLHVSSEDQYAKAQDDELPFIQENFGTPFDYSGTSFGKNRIVEPK